MYIYIYIRVALGLKVLITKPGTGTTWLVMPLHCTVVHGVV